MAHEHFIVYVCVLSLLLLEVLYFLFSAVWYLYKNPQYRCWWAVFGFNEPENIQGVKAKTETVGSFTSQDYEFTLKRISSKREAFVKFGLDTIANSILMPFYLICVSLFIIVRLRLEVIKHENQWSEHRIFCGWVYHLTLFLVVAHHIIQLTLCVPALKAEYLYKTNSWLRYLVLFSMLVIALVCIMNVVYRAAMHWHVVSSKSGDHYCIPEMGTGLGESFVHFIMIGHYVCLILTFLTLIVPLCVQRRKLLDVQNGSTSEQDEELLALLIKINTLSKRVCVCAVVVTAFLIAINVLFTEFQQHPIIVPYLSMSNFFIYVNLYLIVIWVYPKWKQRLYPWQCGTTHEESASHSNCNEETV